jgi:hypothetical protein
MGNYRVVIGSPVAYEELVAYIVIKDVYIALLQIENGKDNMVLEFFEDTANQKVDLKDFLDAVEEAKADLLK